MEFLEVRVERCEKERSSRGRYRVVWGLMYRIRWRIGGIYILGFYIV